MRIACRLLPAALLALILSPGPAAAQQMDNSGYVSGTQDVLSAIPLADGRVAQRLLFQLTVISDNPENPFHLATQDCFASYIFSDERPVGGKAFCDGINADGDMWWLAIDVSEDGVVHWRHIGGTGKLAGIESNGATLLVAQFDDGKLIGRFEGTYTLP